MGMLCFCRDCAKQSSGDPCDLGDTSEQAGGEEERVWLLDESDDPHVCAGPPHSLWISDSLTPVSGSLQTRSIRVSFSKQIDFISWHMMCKGLCWLKGCDVIFWCCHWWAKPLSPWSIRPPPPQPSPPPPQLFLAQFTGSLPKCIGSH